MPFSKVLALRLSSFSTSRVPWANGLGWYLELRAEAFTRECWGSAPTGKERKQD